VNDAFKPKDGKLWAFYNDNLSKYLVKQGTQYAPDPSAGMKLNERFVQFFNRAAAFSDAAYQGGSADPHFSYSVKPVFPPELKSVTLTIDGQTGEIAAGAGPKKFNWQSGGAHGVSMTAHYPGSGDVPYAPYEGLWAVFEWVNDADARQGSTLEWRFKTGKQNRSTLSPVRFDIDNPVLLKGYFAGMGCVSEIAKP
jgi:type VI protein secretion system component VasK